MKKYLLDTNICIYYLKGLFGIENHLAQVGVENCYISVITLAELQYGVANSHENKKLENQEALLRLKEAFPVVPLDDCTAVFAEIKTALKKKGIASDNFDLLIAATAIAHNMILVTRNVKHFERIEGIHLENWVD
jgi:tRNA(fMet)-specific endonuclease VapC